MSTDIWISIFAALGFALTGIHVVLARKQRPTWKTGVTLLLACAELTLTRALQGLSSDFATRLLWYKMSYVGFAIVPSAFFWLALRYTKQEPWLTRRVQFTLSIAPMLFIGLAFTNELHGWMWNPASTAHTVNTMLFPPITETRLGYWFFVVLSYCLLAMGCFSFMRMAARNRGAYDWQIYTIVFSTILAAIGCALDILGTSPLPPFTAVVLGLAVSIILVIIALAALRRRDMLSISHDAVFNSISDGIIVVDGYNWIVDLNPAAEKLTGKAAQVIGKPIAQVLPELSAILTAQVPIGCEVRVEHENTQLTFDLRVSVIRDWQSQVASQVIVLRDITSHKRAETELTAERKAERKFSEQLTILAAITNELSKTGTLDEFCHYAVEAGREQFGFDRLGLWFVSEDRATVLGAYDTHGGALLTHEHHEQRAFFNDSPTRPILKKGLALPHAKDTSLYRVDDEQLEDGEQVVVGLCDGETVIGFLSVDNLINGRPFSPHDCELLRLYAATLSHLYTLKRAQAALAALYEISQTLGSSLNLDEALRTVLDSAIRIAGAARGCLMLFDGVGSQLCFRLARNAQQEMLAENQFEISHSVINEVAQTGQPVITINAQDDPRFADKRSVVKYALRSIMAAPLIAHGKITGVLYVDNKIKDALFNQRNLALFNTFAGQAAVTLENARLYEAVRRYAVELEERVAERTAKLELANKELESFTYSVSHDLRAPLRAINGYTCMLVDEHGASLDVEAKRICAVVQDETQRMNDLINGLLAISRLSHTELRAASSIDMQDLAYSVFEELTSRQDRQRIDLQIASLPQATGDPILIHQVWINLISNAIKFSSKCERATIRISANQTDSEIVYAVSDNGVGFDMQYASKLFGVFQRLHTEKDFPGNGVGLAIVQRIVQRHHGRVWAESEVGQGTVFCFSLPQEKVDNQDHHT